MNVKNKENWGKSEKLEIIWGQKDKEIQFFGKDLAKNKVKMIKSESLRYLSFERQIMKDRVLLGKPFKVRLEYLMGIITALKLA